MKHKPVFQTDSCTQDAAGTPIDDGANRLGPVQASGLLKEEDTVFLKNLRRCIRGRMKRDILNLAPTEHDIIDGDDGYISVGTFIERTIAKTPSSTIYERWVADVIDRLYWDGRQLTGSDLRAVIYVFKRDNGLLLKSDMKICQDASLAMEEAREAIEGNSTHA